MARKVSQPCDSLMRMQAKRNAIAIAITMHDAVTRASTLQRRQGLATGARVTAFATQACVGASVILGTGWRSRSGMLASCPLKNARVVQGPVYLDVRMLRTRSTC
jgi:hypothetical protein